jgi:hypothetical protein
MPLEKPTITKGIDGEKAIVCCNSCPKLILTDQDFKCLKHEMPVKWIPNRGIYEACEPCRKAFEAQMKGTDQ